MMVIRDDIHAHLQAIGQLVEQLCEAQPVGGSPQRQPPDVNVAGNSAWETENARLRNELDASWKEQERLRQQANTCTAERTRHEGEVAALVSRSESLEAEVAGLKMDVAGKDLLLRQLKIDKADLEAENERHRGAVKRSFGLLLPGYVLEESSGALKSVFKALDEGQLQDMTDGDRRTISALLFFGVLRSTLDSATTPLTFESGSQGRRILDTLRALGEFIAQSAVAPSQAEKVLEFWAGKVIASSGILSDAFSIEVPFVGQAFNSAVMMPSDPDAFLSEVSAVHGWAILTPDRSSALAKALVD